MFSLLLMVWTLHVSNEEESYKTIAREEHEHSTPGVVWERGSLAPLEKIFTSEI